MVLHGRTGKSDSLRFVNLIVTVNDKIEGEFPAPTSVGDERAMSPERSVYRTLGRLAVHLCLLGTKPNNATNIESVCTK